MWPPCTDRLTDKGVHHREHPDHRNDGGPTPHAAVALRADFNRTYLRHHHRVHKLHHRIGEHGDYGGPGKGPHLANGTHGGHTDSGGGCFTLHGRGVGRNSVNSSYCAINTLRRHALNAWETNALDEADCTERTDGDPAQVKLPPLQAMTRARWERVMIVVPAFAHGKNAHDRIVTAVVAGAVGP